MISVKDRPSLRGLKKCEGCGNWNGIRANSCKNKSCKQFVKKSSIKNIPLIEPVELVYFEDGAKLYSVRVRDRGIESRSFVKITDKTLSTDDKGCIIYRNAICYVDTCKYDSKDVNISCKHVKYASMTANKSTVLEIRRDVLAKMCSTFEIQERLWNFYIDHKITAPIVQRVSKYAFTVMCNVTILFPTGFLHVYLTGNTKSEAKYTCACKKRIISLAANDAVILKNDKCDHLVYVMSAILSNASLIEEYGQYVDLFLDDNHLQDKFVKAEEDLNCGGNDGCNETSSFLLDDAILYANDLNNLTTMITDYVDNDNPAGGLELTDCQIELMDQFKLTDHIDLSHSDIELTESDLLSAENIFDTNTIIEIPGIGEPFDFGDLKAEDDVGGQIPSLDFVNWLEAVIEKINLSMDFNGDGSVKDLSFMIPDNFFECLRAKFSIGAKRRLPNSTHIVQNGRYSGLIQHTWKFSRPEILRQIFSTDNIAIEIERKFIQTSPGAYTLLEEMPDVTFDTNNYCKIQPSVYKTYLKLGQEPVANNKCETTNLAFFVIEWIPNALKKCKFGELKFTFRFGHKRHNQIIEKPFTIFK